MKKLYFLLFSLLVGIGSFSFRTMDPDEKLVNSFRNYFPYAEKVNWHESANGFTVYFLDRGAKVKVEYTTDRTMERITRSYHEEQLPSAVRVIVEKRFPGKSIYGITEVTTLAHRGTGFSTDYHVTLEDKTRWYQVKVDQTGNLTVSQIYRKAPEGDKLQPGTVVYQDFIPFLIAFQS